MSDVIPVDEDNGVDVLEDTFKTNVLEMEVNRALDDEINVVGLDGAGDALVSGTVSEVDAAVAKIVLVMYTVFLACEDGTPGLETINLAPALNFEKDEAEGEDLTPPHL